MKPLSSPFFALVLRFKEGGKKKNYQSSRHLYITRIKGASYDQRGEIIIKMAERGISCNVHYKPLPLLTAYQNMGFKMEDHPNAYRFF